MMGRFSIDMDMEDQVIFDDSLTASIGSQERIRKSKNVPKVTVAFGGHC